MSQFSYPFNCYDKYIYLYLVLLCCQVSSRALPAS